MQGNLFKDTEISEEPQSFKLKPTFIEKNEKIQSRKNDLIHNK